MTKKKTKKHSSFLLCLVILIVIACCSYFYYRSLLAPVSDSSDKVIFVVNENTSLNHIIEDLEADGLINSGFAAKIFIRGKDYPVKAGTYELDRAYDIDEILDYISDSDNAIIDTVTITFIEGDWIKDIVRRLSENTVLTEDELYAYISDEDVLKTLIGKYDFLTDAILDEDIRYPLEGYLFPDTYEFYVDTTCERAIGKMLDQTEKVYLEYRDEFNDSELSIHEIFTLASIVEYESGKSEDMKMIAGVFYNRLHISMPLQSSVTVCYAIDIDEDGDWKDCETNPDYDSEYNTYMYPGLTPGPILNFGRNALDAVLNPTDNDYYFFMADVYGDGTVYYAETYSDHLKNVNKYLK